MKIEFHFALEVSFSICFFEVCLDKNAPEQQLNLDGG